jgi:hypothetical protein
MHVEFLHCILKGRMHNLATCNNIYVHPFLPWNGRSSGCGQKRRLIGKEISCKYFILNKQSQTANKGGP